jgi:predicted transposase/invertase (TIGR01784 family)
MSGPHDSLFKAAFEQPENAAALVRSKLPLALHPCFDWSTMRLVPGSFVDEQLRHRHTDLVFTVASMFGPAYIFILFEHQSRNHPRMPLRMSRYMDRLWSRFELDHPDEPLPLIVPLVISHAPEGWNSPEHFHQLFAPELFELAPELVQYVPSFRILVDDLCRTSDDQLASRALANFAKVVLWLLRDGRVESRLRATMSKWVGLLDGLPRASLAAIVTYLAGLTSDPVIWEEFRATLHIQAPKVENEVMTLAEQWFAEGEAKGEARGEAKGKAELLLKLLGLKFRPGGELPEPDRARLTSASVVELDVWAERVLFAATLEQVFAE